MMSTCANIILKQVLSNRRAKKLSLQVLSRSTFRVLSKPSETTIMALYQTISLFIEMELEIQ
jgi:hypothetical protein